MSVIKDLPSAADVLASSITSEAACIESALVSIINEASNCGQTSVIFSTRLNDEQIKSLENKGYTVNITGVNPEVTPQYIISWK